jgi:hypothetical protein
VNEQRTIDHRCKRDPSFPVWQCHDCGTVWISDLIRLQAGFNPDRFSKVMVREFGAFFKYRTFL